jgi:uncharacterized protein (TIGR04255 family)
LIELLKDTYPDFETQTEQTFQVAISAEGTLLPVPSSPRLKLKFSKREGPFLLQVAEDTFTINALRPYPGWERLRSEFELVWPVMREVIKPASANRIGMRYINRIIRQTASETPGFWLRESDYIPNVLLTSGPNFLVRLEIRRDSTNRVIVTISHDKTISSEPFGSLIFDIDRISETPLATEIEVISTGIEALHEDIWDIFSKAKNERLESLLKGAAHESAA